jgi:hypothetical protein
MSDMRGKSATAMSRTKKPSRLSADERDETLPEKLKGELPGIMQWMIDGCVDWQERGLAPAEVVTTATAAYLEAEDALAAWIEESGRRDPNAWPRGKGSSPIARVLRGYSRHAAPGRSFGGRQQPIQFQQYNRMGSH